MADEPSAAASRRDGGRIALSKARTCSTRCLTAATDGCNRVSGSRHVVLAVPASDRLCLHREAHRYQCVAAH